ncbi:hypothetical protein [Chitinophaga filiformis]|uniref:Uncharacterized protein n=1 Tax=Chitinophaga filiformis TaxID=104663 RepID=A0A1G7SUX4_CHIFI|nr:hypothetical protein [Chitinophaga filiformis]SDG26835.1 hypothetical protein SAMN04488121_1031025 [Chitinophaga filiformis]
MNKAKVLLSAIGLLAVIGGTIAFKAEKGFNGSLFCTYTRGAIATTITRWSTSPFGVARYCTTIAGVQATVTYTVTINP